MIIEEPQVLGGRPDAVQGVPKKTHHKDFDYFCLEIPLSDKKNHWFKHIYDKIYTIGYYLGFYISLRDKIWENGGHLEFYSKDEEKLKIMYQINL